MDVHARRDAPDYDCGAVQSDIAARIWDLQTGRETARVDNQQNPAAAGIWSMFADARTGRMNLILGSTFTVDAVPVRAVWRTSDLVDFACAQLARNMRPEEWR